MVKIISEAENSAFVHDKSFKLKHDKKIHHSFMIKQN